MIQSKSTVRLSVPEYESLGLSPIVPITMFNWRHWAITSGVSRSQPLDHEPPLDRTGYVASVGTAIIRSFASFLLWLQLLRYGRDCLITVPSITRHRTSRQRLRKRD